MTVSAWAFAILFVALLIEAMAGGLSRVRASRLEKQLDRVCHDLEIQRLSTALQTSLREHTENGLDTALELGREAVAHAKVWKARAEHLGSVAQQYADLANDAQVKYSFVIDQHIRHLQRAQQAVRNVHASQLLHDKDSDEMVSEEYLLNFTLLEHAVGLRSDGDEFVQLAKEWQNAPAAAAGR